MDIKTGGPTAFPSSWLVPQTVNMSNYGRKSSWAAQLSPYLRNLKIKNLVASPKSPGSPKFSPSPTKLQYETGQSTFQMVHTPDRPERPISRTAIPDDEQCMQFLMSLQRQEEHNRGGVKRGLKMWPYPEEEEAADRRCLRSVRVESVHLEEARLARTSSSGPAKVVEVRRSSTKSSTATCRTRCTSPLSISDTDEFDGVEYVKNNTRETVEIAPLSPPPTLSRSQYRLDQYTTKGLMSRWSDDSESLFSSKDFDSPCKRRTTFRSSAGASPPAKFDERETMRSSTEMSSPTVFDSDDLSDPHTPSLTRSCVDRPTTPVTDPSLLYMTDSSTPPPSDHIVHRISPEKVPRKYSWRSSRDTVLGSGTPVSRFQSWLPEPRPKVAEQQQPQQQPQQPPELEIYGDWADYYFEDGNFWDEEYSGSDDAEERREGKNVDDHDDEEREYDDDECDDFKDENDEVENERQSFDPEMDDRNVYPRYESFIKDFNNNVINSTAMEV